MTKVGFFVYLFLLVVYTILFMVTKEVIVVVMTEDLDLSLKRPATIPLIFVYKVLMVVGEMDIGLRPALLPPIIRVGLLDSWIDMFMFMRGFYIGIIPSTFLHITMVDYTFYAQGSLNNKFQGACDEKKI